MTITCNGQYRLTDNHGNYDALAQEKLCWKIYGHKQNEQFGGLICIIIHLTCSRSCWHDRSRRIPLALAAHTAGSTNSHRVGLLISNIIHQEISMPWRKWRNVRLRWPIRFGDNTDYSGARRDAVRPIAPLHSRRNIICIPRQILWAESSARRRLSPTGGREGRFPPGRSCSYMVRWRAASTSTVNCASNTDLGMIRRFSPVDRADISKQLNSIHFQRTVVIRLQLCSDGNGEQIEIF